MNCRLKTSIFVTDLFPSIFQHFFWGGGGNDIKVSTKEKLTGILKLLKMMNNDLP